MLEKESWCNVYNRWKSQIRKSHENPVLKQIYSEYIGVPGGHKAHELFHTTYSKNKIIILVKNLIYLQNSTNFLK